MCTYSTFGHSCGTLTCAWSMHAPHYIYNNHPQQMYTLHTCRCTNLSPGITQTHLSNLPYWQTRAHTCTHTTILTHVHMHARLLTRSLPPPHTQTRNNNANSPPYGGELCQVVEYTYFTDLSKSGARKRPSSCRGRAWVSYVHCARQRPKLEKSPCRLRK